MDKHKTLGAIIGAALLSSIATTTAAQKNNKLSFSGNINALSELRVAGVQFSSDPHLNTNVTGCYDNTCITGADYRNVNNSELNSKALFADHTFNLGKDSSLMLMHAYLKPKGASGIHEGMASLSSGNWSADMTVNYDTRGWAFDLSRSKQIGSLDATLLAGFNNNYWLFDKEGNDTKGIRGALTLGKDLTSKTSFSITGEVGHSPGIYGRFSIDF